MTTRTTEMFLVRHGQTSANVARLFVGATDTPLNELGLKQAELVGARIGKLADISSLYSSPLQRALFTARAIARNIGLDPIIEAGLAEMNFGAVEGHNIDQLALQWPELMKQIRESLDADIQFPEGESRRQFHNRVRTTLDAIATAAQGQRIVVVAHGGVISSAVAQILGDDPGQWQKYSVDNCSVTHIELSTSKPVAHLINDVVHLEVLNVEHASLPNRP